MLELSISGVYFCIHLYLRFCMGIFSSKGTKFLFHFLKIIIRCVVCVFFLLLLKMRIKVPKLWYFQIFVKYRSCYNASQFNFAWAFQCQASSNGLGEIGSNTKVFRTNQLKPKREWGTHDLNIQKSKGCEMHCDWGFIQTRNFISPLCLIYSILSNTLRMLLKIFDDII